MFNLGKGCPECGTPLTIMYETVPECCMNPDEDGNCCNCPVPSHAPCGEICENCDSNPQVVAPA